MSFQDAIASVPFTVQQKPLPSFSHTAELLKGLSEPARSLTPAGTEPALHLGKRLEHRMFSLSASAQCLARNVMKRTKGEIAAYQGVRVRG